MATYDTWGGSWGTSWGVSWTRAVQVPSVVTEAPSASNWQGYRHKKRLTDEELAELVRQQRIELGILPPDLPGQAVAEPAEIAEEVTAAVQDVVANAEMKIDKRRIYRAAYLEAEYAIAEYRDLTRRHKRRKRAAMLMLLH